MRSKLYKHVERWLLNDYICRNSDKKLVWQIWREQGVIIDSSHITHSGFMRAKSVGTILRTRRKVVENYKKKGQGHLVMPIKAIEKARQHKANFYKGMHVYQEEM